MILNPTPFLVWNGVYKGPINHVAMAQRFASTSPVVTDIGFRVSGDGRRFHQRAPEGDLAAVITKFYPTGIRKIGSALYAFGRLWDIDNHSRCALFRSIDGGRTWNHKVTSIDGAPGASGLRNFVGIAANDDYLVVLSSTGERAVSTDDGDTFTGYGNVGFSGEEPARCLAASAAGFVAGGTSGQLRAAADPRGTWSSQTSHISGTISVAEAGNVFLILGANGQAATAALNNLSAWTARTTGIVGAPTGAAYRPGHWFVWSPSSWRHSVDATSGFSTPDDRPALNPRDVYHDGAKWVALQFAGGVSVCEDDETWQDIEQAGLISAGYVGSAA